MNYYESLEIPIGIVMLLAIALTIGRFVIRWRDPRIPASARCDSYFRTSASARWSDYLNGAAALALLALAIFLICEMSLFEVNYLSTDPGEPTADEMLQFKIVSFAVWQVVWVIIYLVKFSFLFLYRSIFAVSRSFQIAWWCVFCITWISFYGDVIAAIWFCGPATDLFNLPKCYTEEARIDRANALYMAVAVNVFSDLCCMALPFSMLPSLRMSLSNKLGLALIFALALVTIALDVLRTVILISGSDQIFLVTLEPTMAVIVCALPVYGKVIGRITHRLGGCLRRQHSQPPSERSDDHLIGVSKSTGTSGSQRSEWSSSQHSDLTSVLSDATGRPPSLWTEDALAELARVQMQQHATARSILETESPEEPWNYGVNSYAHQKSEAIGV